MSNDPFGEDIIVDDETEAIIEAIGDQLQRGVDGVYVVDIQRVKEMMVCHRELRRQLHGATIACVLDEMSPGCGVIRVESSGFRVRNTERFMKAISLASNYEIYPKTNGKIMFALTFYGLRKKIGE